MARPRPRMAFSFWLFACLGARAAAVVSERHHRALRASIHPAEGAHAFSQHGVAHSDSQQSDDSVKKILGALNERLLDAWNQLDQLRAECSISEDQATLRRKQLEGDIARLSDQSARLQGLRSAAVAGLQEAEELFAELKYRRESQHSERMARRHADELRIYTMENDTRVAMGIVNYTRCEESSESSSLLAVKQASRFPATHVKLCRASDSHIYLRGDLRASAWLQDVMATQKFKQLFHTVLGKLAGRMSLARVTAHRGDGDGQAYVIGPSVNSDEVAASGYCSSSTSSLGDAKALCDDQESCTVLYDPDCSGQYSYCTASIAELQALGSALASTASSNSTNSTNSSSSNSGCTRLKSVIAYPSNSNYELCTIGELNCGKVHASAVLMMSELKDGLDDLKEKMALSDKQAREASEEIDMQLQLLHQSKGELNSQMAEATSKLNGVQEEMVHARTEMQMLDQEIRQHIAECSDRERDLMDNQMCTLRSLREAAVNESSSISVDDIVDCDVSDWEPGECSVECDDSCPAWKSNGKSCGGERTMTRQVVQEASELGLECPPLEMAMPCNQVRCPVDCQMSEWSGWSECTRRCDGGVRQRTRSVLHQPRNGGEACDAPAETQPCGTGACTPICQLGDWTEWSPCSAACGEGYQQRFQLPLTPRQCPADQVAGKQETRQCAASACKGDEVCTGRQDIVVAVDSSGSLTSHEYELLRNFSRELVGRFNTTAYCQNASRVGVVQFGNGEVFDCSGTITSALKALDFSSDSSEISEAIGGLSQQEGFANYGQAMAMAETMFNQKGSEPGREQVLLIVGGSTPSFLHQSRQKAREMSRRGIRVFVALAADSSGGPEARSAQDLASTPQAANYMHLAWPDLGPRMQEYVEKAVTHSCRAAESPSLIQTQIEDSGFELLRKGGACAERPRKVLDRYATDPAHCAQIAADAGLAYFAYGTGPRDGYCYGEEANDDTCDGQFRRSFSDFYKLLDADNETSADSADSSS